MFLIKDGRDYFYQWDIDRKLVVEDRLITEVHFCNRTDNCALVCETYVEDGLTVVNVPNILLQTAWKIHVYAYDGKHTKHDECFEVKSRSKPSDYVYTETEVINFEALEARMEALENKEAAASRDTVGVWQPDTQYFERDVVLFEEGDIDYNIIICTEEHISGEEIDWDYWTTDISVNNLSVNYADYAYSAEEAYYAEEAGSVEYAEEAGSAEYAGFADNCNYAYSAEFALQSVDGYDLTPQVLHHTILPLSKIIFEFDNSHNKIRRVLCYISEIEFNIGEDEYPEYFSAELAFDAGKTPPMLVYTSAPILNWVGTDCSTSEDNYSIFAPSANTHYDILFYFNGTSFVGLVNGYKLASGNV